jgi:hypothetical protein
MSEFKFSNNFIPYKIAAGIGSGDTSINVEAGKGVNFPSPGAGQEARCVLFDALGNFEVIKLVTRVVDAFTVIVRAQEGTAARAWLTNDWIQLRWTKETAENFVQKDGTNLMLGATPLAFDGTTAGTFKSTVTIVNPTADRTITVPDEDVDLTGLVHKNGNETITGNKTFSGLITMTAKAILEAQVSIAAATTTDILGAAGNTILMTGNSPITITSLGTSRQAGAKYHVTSTGTGAHVLTYNATSMILESAANITVAQGDSWWVEDLGGNNARVYGYTRAAGNSLVGLTFMSQQITSSTTFTMPNAQVFAGIVGGGGGGGATYIAGAEGGGGAAGDIAFTALSYYAPGTSLTVNIGGPGAGKGGGADGDPGGTTSIVDPNGNILLSAQGGLGGINGTPGAGGAGAGVYYPTGATGNAGEAGATDGNDFGGDGGNSFYRRINSGAISQLGGLGSTFNNGPGAAPGAGVYGAGGGGSTGAAVSGAGTGGAAFFWWWI